MRYISLRNSLMGNGYMVNLLIKMTRGSKSGRGIADNGNTNNNGNKDSIGNTGGNLDIAVMIAQRLRDLFLTIVTQIKNSANNQGNMNGGGGKDNINGENNKEGHEHGNLRNRGNNNNGNGCSYKEFMVSQPKEFDGKDGAIAYTRWVEKMELVIDMSNCVINQRVKYVAGLLTEKVLTWWNIQVQARGRATVVGMACDDFKRLLREEYCPCNGMQKLENKFWNHTMKKSSEKKKDDGEIGKQKDAKGNNKRDRTRKGFVVTDFGKKEYKGGFDAIMGMDWLSKLRTEIVCHERVIHILLPNGKILEVHGEQLKENLKRLVSIKADEKKLEDISIVRDFPKVSPKDLTRLPAHRLIELRIDLIPKATPVAKASYHLEPFEMQELPNQLQEL
nr:reverse transcriptase domain-containing protein [Tanacetum cinerariifolium]